MTNSWSSSSNSFFKNNLNCISNESLLFPVMVALLHWKGLQIIILKDAGGLEVNAPGFSAVVSVLSSLNRLEISDASIVVPLLSPASSYSTSANMKESPWMEGVKGRKGEPTSIPHDTETTTLNALHWSPFSGVLKEHQKSHYATLSVFLINCVMHSSRSTEIALLAAHSPYFRNNSSIKRLKHIRYNDHKTISGIICSTSKTLSIFRLNSPTIMFLL